MKDGGSGRGSKLQAWQKGRAKQGVVCRALQGEQAAGPSGRAHAAAGSGSGVKHLGLVCWRACAGMQSSIRGTPMPALLPASSTQPLVGSPAAHLPHSGRLGRPLPQPGWPAHQPQTGPRGPGGRSGRAAPRRRRTSGAPRRCGRRGRPLPGPVGRAAAGRCQAGTGRARSEGPTQAHSTACAVWTCTTEAGAGRAPAQPTAGLP